MPIPTPTEQLFTSDELANWLGKEIDTERWSIAERVVWGWVRPRLGATERPTPVPAEVFSWAIELGGIAHENPLQLDSRQLGEESRAYSSERRDELLAEISASVGGTATAPRSRGRFPAAPCYPDPAARAHRW